MNTTNNKILILIKKIRSKKKYLTGARKPADEAERRGLARGAGGAVGERWRRGRPAR